MSEVLSSSRRGLTQALFFLPIGSVLGGEMLAIGILAVFGGAFKWMANFGILPQYYGFFSIFCGLLLIVRPFTRLTPLLTAPIFGYIILAVLNVLQTAPNSFQAWLGILIYLAIYWVQLKGAFLEYRNHAK